MVLSKLKNIYCNWVASFVNEEASQDKFKEYVETGSVCQVQALLKKNGLPETDQYKESFLFMALKKGEKDIAELLKDYGACFTIPDIYLLNTNIRNYIYTIKFYELINFQDANNATLLMKARTEEAVKSLLDVGANPNLTDTNGHNALMYAVAYDSFSAALPLIKVTKNINIANQDGDSALTLAAKKGAILSVMAILEANPDVTHFIQEKDTILKTCLETANKFTGSVHCNKIIEIVEEYNIKAAGDIDASHDL